MEICGQLIDNPCAPALLSLSDENIFADAPVQQNQLLIDCESGAQNTTNMAALLSQKCALTKCIELASNARREIEKYEDDVYATTSEAISAYLSHTSRVLASAT